MTLNAVRFGSVWQTGHRPGVALDGFRAFLRSPSGAIVVYAPPVAASIAGLAAVCRARHAVGAAVTAGVVPPPIAIWLIRAAWHYVSPGRLRRDPRPGAAS